jgi:hypothetical protein
VVLVVLVSIGRFPVTLLDMMCHCDIIEHMFDEGDRSFRGILAEVEAFVAGLDASSYGPGDLSGLICRITRVEKLCGNARILLSARAAKDRLAEADGTTSAAKWLAERSGEDVFRARRDLETAGRLSDQPELAEAMRQGRVSPTQAAVLLPALEADPACAAGLLAAAGADSLHELRNKALTVVAARRSEEEATLREARLRANRQLRIATTAEGAVSIRGELSPVEGAVVKNALEAMSKKVFSEARREGRRESHEAYMADALYRLCRPGGSEKGGGSPRAEIVLHVSLEALRRGETETGERCEIEGVGPVPLSTVEYLFGTSWAKLVVEKGVDIVNVTHLGRNIPAHLETAVSKRDLVCAVPGCGITWGLERDHIVGLTDGGPTELANLVKLCHRHHLLKTHRFWRLTGSPGNWQWVNTRPGQNLVAEGDLYDVARPGEPTAGLARPALRPREPIDSPFAGPPDGIQAAPPGEPSRPARPRDGTQTKSPGEPSRPNAPPDGTQAESPGEPARPAPPPASPGNATRPAPPPAATQANPPGEPSRAAPPPAATRPSSDETAPAGGVQPGSRATAPDAGSYTQASFTCPLSEARVSVRVPATMLGAVRRGGGGAESGEACAAGPGNGRSGSPERTGLARRTVADDRLDDFGLGVVGAEGVENPRGAGLFEACESVSENGRIFEPERESHNYIETLHGSPNPLDSLQDLRYLSRRGRGRRDRRVEDREDALEARCAGYRPGVGPDASSPGRDRVLQGCRKEGRGLDVEMLAVMVDRMAAQQGAEEFQRLVEDLGAPSGICFFAKGAEFSPAIVPKAYAHSEAALG